MKYTQTDPDIFDRNAGELCLAFANTVDWHASERPEEKLRDCADLVLWARTLEVISEEQALRLWSLCERRPEEAADVMDEAIRLREVIYRIFSAIAAQEDVSADDLDLLNQALSWSLPHLRLEPAGDHFHWEWHAAPDALDRILWPIAHSAGELLASDRLGRVGQCADDRGCGWLFLDTSRNRSRRWCSMESCGNRAKVMRHYVRSRSE